MNSIFCSQRLFFLPESPDWLRKILGTVLNSAFQLSIGSYSLAPYLTPFSNYAVFVLNEFLVPALDPDGLQRASVDCYKNPCRMSRLLSLGALVIMVLTVAPRVCRWCSTPLTLVLPSELLSGNSGALMTPFGVGTGVVSV